MENNKHKDELIQLIKNCITTNNKSGLLSIKGWNKDIRGYKINFENKPDLIFKFNFNHPYVETTKIEENYVINHEFYKNKKVFNLLKNQSGIYDLFKINDKLKNENIGLHLYVNEPDKYIYKLNKKYNCRWFKFFNGIKQDTQLFLDTFTYETYEVDRKKIVYDNGKIMFGYINADLTDEETNEIIGLHTKYLIELDAIKLQERLNELKK